MSTRILSSIKSLLVPSGTAPHTIKTGLFSGIRLNMDMRSNTQLMFGLYERETYHWFNRLSSNVRTAIDIGANSGLHTLYFLKKTSAEKVLVFEPLDECRNDLTANLKLNGFENDTRLEIIPHWVNSYVNSNTSSLDSIIPKIRTPCLIKMDVDTCEVNVLNGAHHLFELPDVHWIIETHSPALEVDCMKILSEAGYRTEIIFNAWWRFMIPELRPIEHNRWLAVMGHQGKKRNRKKTLRDETERSVEASSPPQT
jgi:hypothetical protein